MRIVFFGTGLFAVPALRVCASHCVLAVSQPGRPSGRGLTVRPSAVEVAARELGLPVETPEKARDPEFIARVRDHSPDLLVVASYGQILKQSLLDAARIAPINLHGSILPAWRGAAPIQRAVEAGDRQTGVTLMRMDAGMDTGPMIDVARTPVEADETSGELQERLAFIAADLLALWLPRLGSGEFEAVPQPEAGVSLAPKIAKEDARIDPRNPGNAEYDRYRAFTPAPGAFLSTRLGILKVRRARLIQGTNEAPGNITLSKDGLVLACAGGSLLLDEVQAEGKRRTSGLDLANGARLKTGDNLLPPEDE